MLSIVSCGILNANIQCVGIAPELMSVSLPPRESSFPFYEANFRSTFSSMEAQSIGFGLESWRENPRYFVGSLGGVWLGDLKLGMRIRMGDFYFNCWMGEVTFLF